MSRSDDGTADTDTTAVETPGETSIDLSRPDERIAHERARYLEATTELRPVEADAVAWSELGYSSSAIAKQIDSGASTVTTYLERAIAAYGPEAAHARATSDLATDADLTPVAEGDVLEWPAHYREVWRDAVERHPDRAADVATSEVGR
jgi:DNA-binding CsgD family transcriptional regulator